MPHRPPHPCNRPGCPALTRERFCPAHARAEMARLDSERGTVAERGYRGHWPKLRAAVLRAEPACRACGAPASHVDHIVAKRRGGTDEWSNLQALCATCHRQKTVREDGGFGRGGGSKVYDAPRDHARAHTRIAAGFALPPPRGEIPLKAREICPHTALREGGLKRGRKGSETP